MKCKTISSLFSLLNTVSSVFILLVVFVVYLHHEGCQLPGSVNVDRVGSYLDGLLGLLIQQIQLDWITII